MSPSLARIPTRPLLLALLGLAFALRVYDLGDRNIWWDEGLAAWAARLSPMQIVEWTAHDVHPPLYFWLLSAWWRVVGDGEFVLRFPSALAGTAGVALIYGLGRALGGRWVGLLSATTLTLSVFAISWSQEMRMYIWAAALATGTLWAAFRLWSRAGRLTWIAYVLTCATALWTLYLNVSVLVIANLGFLLVWWGRGCPWPMLLRWASAQTAALVLFAPWLIYALPRIPTWSTAEPFTPGFFAQLYATMLAVGIPVNLETYTPLVVSMVMVWLVGLWVLWRQGGSVEQHAGRWMLLLGVALPALVVYAVSLPINFFYYAPRLAPRYLLPLAPCFYTLLALGLVALWQRWRWAGGLATVVVLGVAVSGWDAFFPNRVRRDDLISVAEALRAHVQPSDRVVLHSDKDWPLFAAQYAGVWRGVPYGATVDMASANSLLGPVWESAEGVWLVTTPDSLRIDPQAEIEHWLGAHAQSTTRWNFSDHTLALYARTPQRAATRDSLRHTFTPPHNINSDSLLGARVPVPRYQPGDTIHLALYWSQPPVKPFTVTLEGATTLKFNADSPMSGTRQIVLLPLPPDLPSGDYRVFVDVSTRAEAGSFAVIPRSLNSVTIADIGTRLDVRLGESIRLLGYTLATTRVAPGSALALTLYWQADATVTERYKVFTHVVGQEFNAATNNFLWGQQDNEPVTGFTPTNTWPPGVVIADPYAIPLAADAPPGTYTLSVGLYGLIDGVRLEAFSAEGKPLGDVITLAILEVR
ncbi:MAG: glycosyltransferase family 39 protein [Anaerolineales bacterium]